MTDQLTTVTAVALQRVQVQPLNVMMKSSLTANHLKPPIIAKSLACYPLANAFGPNHLLNATNVLAWIKCNPEDSGRLQRIGSTDRAAMVADEECTLIGCRG